MTEGRASVEASQPDLDDTQLLRAARSWLLGACVDLSTCAGLVLLFSGISQLRLPVLGELRWGTYGGCFLPLAACLVFGIRAERSALFMLIERWRPRLDALPAGAMTLLLWASMAVICVGHGVVVFRRHLGFMTGMDLAIYANACRGALYSTMKGDVWIFADHFEPILLLFTPLCRVTSSPAGALLVVQLFAFACGGHGIFALARTQGWSASSAWLASIVYLLFAGTVAPAYYDFHLIALALGLIPWIWYALRARRYRLLLSLGLLSLGLKESAALSLAGFGAYLLCQREPQQRRVGMIFVAAGVTTFLLISNVVFPLFRHGEGTMYYSKYYGHLGSSPSEIIKNVVARPALLVETLFTSAKIKYVLALLLPFLLIHVRKPVLLLPVLPAIAINVLSNDPYLIKSICHYDSEIYPALFAMGVIAFTQAGRFRALWLAVMVVACLGPSPVAVARGIVVNQHHARLRKQLEDYAPHDRSIAAPQAIAAHLTDRKGLYMFDYFGMQDDWSRAEVVLIGFATPMAGIYRWSTLNRTILPEMEKRMRLVFQAPDDPRFRLYETMGRMPTLNAHPVWDPNQFQRVR